MKNKWMLALVAATALVPAAAIAQEGRGGRGMDNGARAERPMRGGGGFDRPNRGGAFDRTNRSGVERAAPPTPAPDATPRAPRQGSEQRGWRGRGTGERPAFGREGAPIQRSNERLLNRGPEGRERFTRQRQAANEPFGARPAPGGDIRAGRPDWRGDGVRQGGDRTGWRVGSDRRGDFRPGAVPQRDLRSGRQDWQRGDDRRGNERRDLRQPERRWYGDNDWGRRGGDWNRGSWNRGGGWDRDWRRDGRYDWRGYRTANRSLYRLPRYYAPQGYYGGYRRFGIGFTLNSLLFAPDYWIDDPWSYRLPDADGPYRWVRYYNDALLVDMETGEVVDVEYDMFW